VAVELLMEEQPEPVGHPGKVEQDLILFQLQEVLLYLLVLAVVVVVLLAALTLTAATEKAD
jgi:hypothetical protein